MLTKYALFPKYMRRVVDAFEEVVVEPFYEDSLQYAIIMRNDSINEHSSHRHGAVGRDAVEQLDIQFAGVIGENAWRTVHHLPLLRPDTYIPLADRWGRHESTKLPDISPDIEVRNVSSRDYGVRVRWNDDAACRFACSFWSAGEPTAMVMGWQWGWNVLRDGEWINPQGRGWMAFLRNLYPPSTIFTPDSSTIDPTRDRTARMVQAREIRWS
jgi:hypothetical protein